MCMQEDGSYGVSNPGHLLQAHLYLAKIYEAKRQRLGNTGDRSVQSEDERLLYLAVQEYRR